MLVVTVVIHIVQVERILINLQNCLSLWNKLQTRGHLELSHISHFHLKNIAQEVIAMLNIPWSTSSNKWLHTFRYKRLDTSSRRKIEGK